MAEASDFTPIPRKAAPVADIIEPPGKGQDVPATADMFTATPRPQESTAASLWNGLLNFGQGLGEGIAGAHVPEGRASQYEGGRSGFGGRMVGAGTRGLAEGLWEAIKTPGQVLAGEKEPSVRNALGPALLMAGQGWRHPMGATPAEAFVRLDKATGETLPLRSPRELAQGGLLRGGPGVEGSAPNPFAGGRAEPLPSAGEIRQQPPSLPMGSAAIGEQKPGVMAPAGGRTVPVIPTNEVRQQPTVLSSPGGGAFLPEAKPGVPPQPGARLTMEYAPPVINTGMQPPRGGPALPEQQPGIPPRPGGLAGPNPSLGPTYQQPRNLPLAPGGIPQQEAGPLRAGPPTAGGVSPQLDGMRGGTVQHLPTSPISDAIASGNPTEMDRILTRAYRGAVQPKPLKGVSSPRQLLSEQDRRIVTTFDQIIGDRPNLKYADGSAARLPQSEAEFLEATDQTLRNLYRSYDTKMRESGAAVDLTPAADYLRRWAERPEIRDVPAFSPLGHEALEMAKNLEGRGRYTAEQAQDFIEAIYKSLKGSRGSTLPDAPARADFLANVTQIVRDSLDKAITEASGPGWGADRLRYQAVRSVQDDIARAVNKHANMVPGSEFLQLNDLASAHLLARGIIAGDAKALAHGVAGRAVRWILKKVNDPNRAIAKMFERRANPDSYRTFAGQAGQALVGGEREIRGGLAGGYDAPSDDRRLLKRTVLPEARP